MLKQKKNINMRKVKKIVKSLYDLTENYNKKLDVLLQTEGFAEAHAYSVLAMQKVVKPLVEELYFTLHGGEKRENR